MLWTKKRQIKKRNKDQINCLEMKMYKWTHSLDRPKGWLGTQEKNVVELKYISEEAI